MHHLIFRFIDSEVLIYANIVRKLNHFLLEEIFSNFNFIKKIA